MVEQNQVGGSATASNVTSSVKTTSTQTSRPPFTIVSSKRVHRWLKAMIYGDFGVGKTTLATSSVEVPEMNDCLFCSAEAGDMSISDFDIDMVSVRNYAQLARLHEFLRLHCKYRDENDIESLRKLEAKYKQVPVEEIEEPRQYRTVILDTLNEIQKYAMYQLLGIVVGEQPLDVEPESPQFKEWNLATEMIRLLVRSFRDLPMHVIFVCSEQVSEDERKRRIRTPGLPGKLANEVQGFLDMVGYYVAAQMEGGEIKRRLFLVPGQTYQAKNRFAGWDGKYIDNPTMKDIYALMRKRA